MSLYLRKLTEDIGDEEYMMYQEIPADENGAINNFYHTTLDDFHKLVKERLKEETVILDEENTPRYTFILYDDNYPLGEIMIRPILNKKWRNLSGNIGYKIRPSKRGLGYGNKILELGLDMCRDMNMKEAIVSCLFSNEPSKKVILRNGGIYLESIGLALFYKIEL